MKCSHCGARLGEYFMMIVFNCGHYVYIGAECCEPQMGTRRPQTQVERAEIAAEVAAIFEAA